MSGGWFKYGGQGYKSDLIPSLAGSRQPSSVDAKSSDDGFADVDNDDNTDNKSSKKHPSPKKWGMTIGSSVKLLQKA